MRYWDKAPWKIPFNWASTALLFTRKRGKINQSAIPGKRNTYRGTLKKKRREKKIMKKIQWCNRPNLGKAIKICHKIEVTHLKTRPLNIGTKIGINQLGTMQRKLRSECYRSHVNLLAQTASFSIMQQLQQAWRKGKRKRDKQKTSIFFSPRVASTKRKQSRKGPRVTLWSNSNNKSFHFPYYLLFYPSNRILKNQLH